MKLRHITPWPSRWRFFGVASSQAADKKPNILFIMGDDIGMV